MTLTFTRSISENGLLLYMTDASVYGGINPLRNTLGLVALATFKPTTGNVQYEPIAFLAESVTTFSFNVANLDGVWEVKFWGLPIYTGQALAEGDVVYDVAGGRLIKKKIGGVLTVITLASLLTDVSVSHTGSKMALITTSLSISRDDIELILLGVAVQYQNSLCELQEYQEALKDFNYVRSLRSGAFIQFCRGNYVTAQGYIETGNTFATNVIAEAAVV